MTTKRTLTAEEEAQARNLWNCGKSLGEIARELGVSIHALTPWVTIWQARNG